MGLINYTAFNYLDKFFNFAVPLIVLYVLDDRAIYNEIEYIYSIAAVAVIIVELGVRNYFLYAYKEAAERERLVADVKGCFLLQFAGYVTLGLCVLAVSYLTGTQMTLIYFYVLIRTLFVYFLSFFTIYYRLIDKPSRVFIPSLCVNIATILTILLAGHYLERIDLIYFFVSQLVLVLFTFVYFLSLRTKSSFSQFTGYVKRSLLFAWPIILNLILFMFINNFGKVYARNFLSEQEMFHISFVQRIALIIQLAHVSAIGYMSKRIFIDPSRGVNVRVLMLYSVMMFASAITVIVALVTLSVLELKMTVRIDLVAILIVLYTIVWCYVGFFELYINKANKNRYVLLFTMISSVIFLTIVGAGLVEPLLNISLAMFSSLACNLMLSIWFVSKRIKRNHAQTDYVDSYRNVAVQ